MNIVGMMWNKNEGDILEETIHDALGHVDSLFLADDGSTDDSWAIMQSMAEAYSQIEHIQQKPDPKDKAQRDSLLNEIRRRYKPEDTWVQIIESDIMILETDVREAIRDYAINDLGVTWNTLNGVRRPGTWKEVDTYPDWEASIVDILPLAHYMEIMLYTFRPLPELKYKQDTWRPWPAGFSAYTNETLKVRSRAHGSPLLAHYGFRGPTHFYNKFLGSRTRHSKHPTWDLSSPAKVEETVSFFNGEWNNEHIFKMSRAGWIGFQEAGGWGLFE